MDISAGKLDIACKQNEKYKLICSVSGRIYQYEYNAKKLRKALREKAYKRTKQSESYYSFYFEFKTGRMYRTPRGKYAFGEANGGVQLHGNDELNSAMQGLWKEVAQVIAKTAIWAPVAIHNNCEKENGSYAKDPRIIRRTGTQKRGWYNNNSVYYDCNHYPNKQMKDMAYDSYRVELKDYHTCHVWRNSCKDGDNYTCYANLVLLPSALSSMSDYSTYIISVLKYRSYDLYKWLPDGEPIPEKPDGYPEMWVYPIPKL